jgi:aminoglycoside phosphotransferase (APT) family kinase protein
MSDAPIDRQREFTGTRAPAPGLEIDVSRLAAYLESAVEGFRGPLVLRQFKGGQSNPTYLVEARSGQTVLRRKPPGKLLPSAHAVEREFRVMEALGRAGFPVPRVHHLCRDLTVIGTEFYLMDLVAGRIIWVPSMPEAERAERAATYEAMTATLARLHAIDPATIGLGDFGRGEAYVARQIARWSEQYRASETAKIAAMDRLIEWLPGQVPPQARIAIVHGDYRLDNLILAPESPEIVAVLDWELATLGDPLADFAGHLMQWLMPRSETGAGTGSLLGLDLAGLGIPSLEASIAAYEARSGLAVRPHLDFYLAYGFFRMAAIFQGIVGRVRDGTAANLNAAAVAPQVALLAETAWRLAEPALH